jgi:hypothetical protein
MTKNIIPFSKMTNNIMPISTMTHKGGAVF